MIQASVRWCVLSQSDVELVVVGRVDYEFDADLFEVVFLSGKAIPVVLRGSGGSTKWLVALIGFPSLPMVNQPAWLSAMVATGGLQGFSTRGLRLKSS